MKNTLSQVKIVASLCLLACAPVIAGPMGQACPVAASFPDWNGVSEKNYIAGRKVCPSDLRHKVTVVVEMQPGEKLLEQLILASKLAKKTGLAGNGLNLGANWETAELPRNSIVVISFSKGKDHASITGVMAPRKDMSSEHAAAFSYLKGPGCAIYENVTFTGAPDNGGKLPFVYVMGPEGRQPLYAGAFSEAVLADVMKAMDKGLAEIEAWPNKWRPFYGNVAEPKYHPQLDKAIKAGKTGKGAPLDKVSKAILADVKSPDEEKAKEAQVLFDAIEQARSDLLLRIENEAGTCPHRAYYDVQMLLKYWPSERKSTSAVMEKIRTVPDAEKLAKMFCKVMMWDDPDFTCKNGADAKKVVGELNKMKKTLEPLKGSTTLMIQNGALLLDTKIDELIAQMPLKVPQK